MRDELDALLAEEIDARRREPRADRGDVLSVILDARADGGRPITDAEMRTELIALLEVGLEVNRALNAAAERIARGPGLRARVAAAASHGDQEQVEAIAEEALRPCLRSHFAIYEMRVVLRGVLLRYELELDGDGQVYARRR